MSDPRNRKIVGSELEPPQQPTDTQKLEHRLNQCDRTIAILIDVLHGLLAPEQAQDLHNQLNSSSNGG